MKRKAYAFSRWISLVLLTGMGLTLSSSPAFAQAELVWSNEISTVGIYSSPRAADLNGDGVKDLIVGSGKLEFEQADTAVVAFSGANGEVLWSVPARDQIFGSATLLDITGDGVKDILISGRSALLYAIEGRTGKILWEFFTEYAAQEGTVPSDYGLYNFYNPQLIPDQTGNGLLDILVSNGGDVTAAADEHNRPTGRLMVLDSSNGRVLGQAFVPDGKETYMTPVTSKIHKDDEEYTVIFGTGGETIGGSLYRTTLSEILEGDVSGAIVLAESKKKGFIAPPVLADITGNGHYDVVANAVEGRTMAFDGQTNSLIWEYRTQEEVEIYSSLGVGYFTDSEVPDFFTNYGIGVWPAIGAARQILIRGDTGEVVFEDSLGAYQTSSPVVADFTNDGVDNVLMSINITVVENYIYRDLYNMPVVLDFRSDHIYSLYEQMPGVNLSSTPWIGDLDGNGKIDVVYCSLTETRNTGVMDGFRITRLRTDAEITSEIRWGSYMGSDYDGVFKITSRDQ